MVTDLPLIHALLEDSHNRDSHWHGETHWRAVAQAGWYLANDDPQVDLDVMLLFAVLHDTRRENENHDPEHGHRAAAWLWEIRDSLGLMDSQVRTLFGAIDSHNGAGPLRHHPTIGACFDADRLNLWRVGKAPDPKLLSTPYARRPYVIRWASRLHRDPLSWVQLVQAYLALEERRRIITPRDKLRLAT